MDRRRFIVSSIASTSLAAGVSGLAAGQAEPAAGSNRDYYLLRRYFLRGGPQGNLCHNYFRDALIPAANRLEIKPVGRPADAFSLRLTPVCFP
jgi:hypothetical protein